jgi:protein involved in polysaccharide export with SLBB domain
MAMTRCVGLLGLCLVLLSAWAQDPPRVQPGDSLRITVEGDESLSRVYVVDSTGAFRMPLIGLVQAGGRTTDEVAQEIARRLREGNFYRDPKVTVEIAQRAEPKVTVLGAVRRRATSPCRQAGGSATRSAPPSRPTLLTSAPCDWNG